eukprot:scaffold77338_cov39-Prasinocladus_malaysianus.AAC.1
METAEVRVEDDAKSQSDVDAGSSRIDKLEEELAEVHAMLAERVALVSQLEKSLAEKSSKMADLKAAVFDKEDELASIKAELKEARADLKETTIRLEGSQVSMGRSARRSLKLSGPGRLMDEDLSKAFDSMHQSMSKVNDARVETLQADLARLQDEKTDVIDELEEQK